MTNQTSVDVLELHRAEIDRIDDEVLKLLTRRMEICLNIADIKSKYGIPMMQSSRVSLVLRRAEAHAASAGLEPSYLGGVFRHIVDSTCIAEDARMISRMRGGV